MDEAPTDKEIPKELDDTALPCKQLEMFLWEIKHQPHLRREADRAADYYAVAPSLTPDG